MDKEDGNEKRDWVFCGTCRKEESGSATEGEYQWRKLSTGGGSQGDDCGIQNRIKEKNKDNGKGSRQQEGDKEAGGNEEVKGGYDGKQRKLETAKVLGTTALTRNKAQLFPTTRRPETRQIPTEDRVSQAVIEEWFATTSLQLGHQLSLHEQQSAKRLLYTWKDVFETDLLRIRQTDLIEHAIVLMPNAKPYRARIPLYTEEEIAFCGRLLPKMEEAGLIFRCDSQWGARTKFPLKPRADTLPKKDRLRMVHNFIPLNQVTEKSQYPCPRLEQIVYTILKKGKRFFFTTDAANSYWAIPVRPGDETKLGFVTPYGMYCYNVMGQGLTGGTHTYSRFRDLVFGAIPSGVDPSSGDLLEGSDSLIGDKGDVAFDGMIDDSYGSSTTFAHMHRFLHEHFFPRCVWGPMYLKDSKSFFFCDSLQFVGLEVGPNGLRPSLRKREAILQWPTPTCQADVEAFCYLTPFLRRFIPGRAELVRIIKYGASDVMKGIVKKENNGAVERNRQMEEREFYWNREKEIAFQAIKRAIAGNAMALPNPQGQYHLAVDASKKGIGGVLFQLDGVEPGTEAGNTTLHRSAERIIMFISFRLTDVETRYSNSEREALAVIRCLAEIKWMVIASDYPVLVYTDHSALKTLLTGLDNDAHGRIARWQERLGEYDLRLFHRSARIHFMGIADGLSRLPTYLMETPIAEDMEGPTPVISSIIPVNGLATDVMVNSLSAQAVRSEKAFWNIEGQRLEEEETFIIGNTRAEWVMSLNSGEVREEGVEERVEGSGTEDKGLREAANDMMRRRWEKWLKSGMYGAVVQARLDEWEGLMGGKGMKLGRSERRMLERTMRQYVMVDGRDPKIFYREKNGELASCVLEEDVTKVLHNLHEGHGHFATRITLGRAHGKVYWPSRAKDIGRWVASCLPCQRVSKIQKAGEIRSIIQFKPLDMIGMDYVGPINPPCKATGYAYILVVIDYFSRFLWAVGVRKADQVSTMEALLDHVFPVVGWPLSVYTDNGSHFTGALISKMWADHGVMHFPSAISHPQSVGLSERYVQMLMGRIRLQCLSLGSSEYWSREIRNAVLAINTRCVQVHGYTPAEILLGFNPSLSRNPEDGLDQAIKQGLADIQDGIPIPGEPSIHGYIDSREERSLLAGKRLAVKQDAIQPRKSPGYRIPKPGDLVLIRDFQQAKEKGRKLHARWSTPRLLERVSQSGVSAHVRQLHDPPGLTKRYHFDDLLLFVPRGSDFPSFQPTRSIGQAVHYSRDAMGEMVGAMTMGQRGFDLTDVSGGNGNEGR